jgi:hypothetical protein
MLRLTNKLGWENGEGSHGGHGGHGGFLSIGQSASRGHLTLHGRIATPV